MNSELYKSFNLCFLILWKLGMWQSGSQSLCLPFYGYFMCFSSLAFLETAFGVYSVKAQNALEFLSGFALVIASITEVLKYLNLLCHANSITQSLNTLKTLLEFSYDDRFKHRNHIKVQIMKGFKVYKCFLFGAVFSCVLDFFIPLTAHTLPSKLWAPFDPNANEFIFWGTSIYLICSASYVAVINFSLSIVPELCDWFAEWTYWRLSLIGESSKLIQNELVKCIETHKKIKKLVE